MTKKKHAELLFVAGHTPEGRWVLGGVYAFYETTGLPLGDTLFQLWERNSLPDWNALVADMIQAGRSRERTLEAVLAALADACYPLEFRAEVERELRMRHG